MNGPPGSGRSDAPSAHQNARAKNGVLARLPQREAEALLAAYGLEPAENYRGARAGAWTSRCLRCRQVQRVRLTDLEQGEGGCRTCPPRPGPTREEILHILTGSRWNPKLKEVTFCPRCDKRLEKDGSLHGCAFC
ncbi:hypothetical protein ACQB60_40495 [Actinomycetota bacterium Odt1-20B]